MYQIYENIYIILFEKLCLNQKQLRKETIN